MLAAMAVQKSAFISNSWFVWQEGTTVRLNQVGGASNLILYGMGGLPELVVNRFD